MSGVRVIVSYTLCVNGVCLCRFLCNFIVRVCVFVNVCLCAFVGVFVFIFLCICQTYEIIKIGKKEDRVLEGIKHGRETYYYKTAK